MRAVLFVAYYFPPLGGIGSLRLTEFARHLPQYGWLPTILAPRQGAYFRDAALRFPEERVIRTRSLELSRTGKRILRAGGNDTVPATPHGLTGAARRLARAALYFPDPQIGWYPPAVRDARHALRDTHFDAIFSSSFPITAHLIARHLSQRWAVPWVAEFRDPWSATYPPGTPRRRAASALERSLARSASGLVMTSPSWAAMHSTRWGRPVVVIPNGHDGGGRDSTPQPRPTLAYLGTFYPETQSLTALWDALETMRKDQTRVAPQLKFVGELPPVLRSEIRERGLGELVLETGFLPHDQALRSLGEATMLVVAGPRDAQGILRGHVVAKLFEYLSTDLPILYIGDTDCDAADLLRGFPGCRVLEVADPDGVRQAIEKEDGRRYTRDVSHLSRVNLTSRLAEVLTTAATAGTPT